VSEAPVSAPVDGEIQVTEETGAIWQSVIDRARQAVGDADEPALIALDGEINAMMERPRQEIRRGLPLLSLYHSLAVWARDRQFVVPFDNFQAAKMQNWELDAYCLDNKYHLQFLDKAVQSYGESRGFRMFQRILSTIGDVRSPSSLNDERTQDVQIRRRPGAKMTIVGFAGNNDKFAGVRWRLFDRAIADPLGANLVVLRDHNRRLYLSGIKSLGNHDTSIAKLREILAEFADTRVIASGGSSGGFGAMYYAADLGIRHVVVFSGPSSIEIGEDNEDRQIYRRIANDIEAGRYERPDLPAKINDSAIESIEFFVAGQHAFDMAQLDALTSRCSKVNRRIYPDLNTHVVTDYAIEDRSIFEAFRAGSQATGLVG
jgi:hypothetical protein